MADTTGSLEFIARFEKGERVISSLAELDRCIARCVGNTVSELMLIPSTPGVRLASLAGRVFGLQPRPSMLAQFGPGGALITFFDRPAGDYRVVNREYAGEVRRVGLQLHDRRTVFHRSDELFTAEAAFELVREYFNEGTRPWNVSCRPVSVG